MSWLWTTTPFAAFGWAHLAALGLTAVFAVLVAAVGRAFRGRPAERWFSRGLAVAILLLQGGMQLESMRPANFAIDGSLPLQLCDVAWMVAIYALWTERRWAFGIVYYWGLTATSLAMLTPDLHQGFPHFEFWMFYFGHAVVVVAAVYLCWGIGLRPDWRLYRQTCLLTAGYAAIVYGLNALLRTNYVYLNHPADPGTLLDLFGPYPCHVGVGILLAFSLWAALTWPWELLAQRTGGQPSG